MAASGNGSRIHQGGILKKINKKTAFAATRKKKAERQFIIARLQD